MGFASMSAVRLSSCDTHSTNPQYRLCWHFDQRYGGYRCGNTKGLNSSRDWKKLVMIGNAGAGGAASSQYKSGGCSGSQNSVCSACRTCSAGKYKSGGCTGSTNTVCSTCSVCRSGQYRKSGCSGSVNSVCSNCSVCASG
jgi:hypothetical protein